MQIHRVFKYPATQPETANPCCHSLLWLKHSICLSAFSAVWGYFRTVPNGRALYHGSARLKGERPGLAAHGICVIFSPHVATSATFQQVTWSLSTTALPPVKPWWDWLPFLCLDGVVTHRSNRRTGVKSTPRSVRHHTGSVWRPVADTALTESPSCSVAELFCDRLLYVLQLPVYSARWNHIYEFISKLSNFSETQWKVYTLKFLYKSCILIKVQIQTFIKKFFFARGRP